MEVALNLSGRIGPMFLRPIEPENAPAKRIAIDAEFIAQFRQAQPLALVGYPKGFSHVLRLLFLCRPAAVAGLIISIVVDTVERFAIRPLSHIEKKVLELCPAGANGDSATSIARVIKMVWVAATLPHGVPRSIGAAVPAGAVPMRRRALSANEAAPSATPRRAETVLRDSHFGERCSAEFAFHLATLLSQPNQVNGWTEDHGP